MDGDKGSIVIENDEVSFIHVTPRVRLARRSCPIQKTAPSTQVAEFALPGEASLPAATPAQFFDAHRYQYENFLAALRGTEEIRVGLAENRQTIGVIIGVYESARTGKPVGLV